MTDKPYQYHLTYQVTPPHVDGITRDEVPNGHGGCDAAVIISILYPPDGSYSAMYMSRDGRNGQPLDANEMFKAWIMWAARLSRDKTLHPAKREFVAAVWGDYSSVIAEAGERARMREAARADKKEAMIAVMGLASRMRGRQMRDLKMAIEEAKAIRLDMVESPSLSAREIDRQIAEWIDQLAALEREDADG